MCETLRNTVSRGRSGVPSTRLRIRYLIRSRRSSFVLTRIAGLSVFRVSFGSGLADLLLQHFAGVAHALLLVRVRLAQPPHVGRSEEHTSELQSRLHLVCR